jgi:hypothetical protein
VRSRNPGLAASVVLSVSMLLRPLRWEGLLVPCLPRSMSGALEAPVPYLIGVGSNITITTSMVDGLILDCDTDRCLVTTIYPLLPASVQLCNNLEPILTKQFPNAGAQNTRTFAFDPTPEKR